MVSQVAEQLTLEGINVKPTVVPSADGRKDVVFISNRTGYADIYRRDDRGQVMKLVKGGRAGEFESFHPFESRIWISHDKTMAFAAQGGKTDVLHIWDLEKMQSLESYSFDGIISISSPAWSPDGKQIVMTGITKSGMSDLYLLTLKTGHIEPLTHDIYDDRTPTWSPDGTRIAFSSDRGVYGREGFHNLFVYTLDTREIFPLTAGRYNDTSPVWSPDGTRIAWSSDRSGSFNLYLLRLEPSSPPQLQGSDVRFQTPPLSIRNPQSAIRNPYGLTPPRPRSSVPAGLAQAPLGPPPHSLRLPPPLQRQVGQP